MSIQANFPVTKPSLLLEFINNKDLDPNVTFSRTSTATYFNSAGVLTNSLTNTPRLDYNPTTLEPQGLLIEEARTNYIRNNKMVGAGAGLPGTLPTNWQTFNPQSLNRTITEVGIVKGIHYIEIKITGTATSATQCDFGTELSSFISASSGQKWTHSAWLAQIGSATNAVVRLIASGRDNGNELENTNVIPSLTSTLSRISVSSTLSNVSTLWLYPYINIAIPAAGVVNITFRIGMPQLELGAFTTSVIPSATTFVNRASTGSYFDSVGTLQSAASGVARYTYNPADLSAPPFLLLEEARTNSIRNNTMVGALAPFTFPTNWQTVIAPGITSSITGTGTENGITYLDVNVAGTPSVSTYYNLVPDTLVAGSSGQTWNGSFWGKLVSGSLINTSSYIEIRESDSSQGFLTNTLTTIPITSALTRYTQTRTLTNVLTAFVSVRFVWQLTSGLPVNFTLRIGLPQLEQGAYATSVIPTSNTALTRAADISTLASATRTADVCNIQNILSWYNPLQGTLYAETSGITAVTAIYPSIFAIRPIGDTGSMHTIEIYTTLSGIAGLVRNSGVDQAGMFFAATIFNINKSSVAYATNDSAVVLNNTNISNDNTVTIPTGLTQARIGYNIGNQYLNGYIRRITYYPVRLSNAQLQAITS